MIKLRNTYFDGHIDDFFFFLVFLGPHLRHMEVPRLNQIGATAAGHSHRNLGSEPRLQPTLQLIATQDQPIE